MRSIFFLLDWIAEPLYILLAVLVLWYFYRLLQARSEVSATYFELERDLARRRQANAITMMILALEFCVLLFGVQVRAVPFLETERDLDTVEVAQVGATQDVVFETGTPNITNDGGPNFVVGDALGEESDIIVLTPTPTPTPVGTIVPNAPPIEGCEDPRAQLAIPANGQRVFSPLVVRGTAYTDNFSRLKIEISGPSTLNQFIVDRESTSPVREISDFIQFSPAAYSEGAYQFRLMVFDINTNLVASCQVTIYISDPPNAATPTPGA